MLTKRSKVRYALKAKAFESVLTSHCCETKKLGTFSVSLTRPAALMTAHDLRWQHSPAPFHAGVVNIM